MSVRVHDLAHSRTGDKGDRINISVIAFDDAGFRHLGEHLTCERVMETFAALAAGPCQRFELAARPELRDRPGARRRRNPQPIHGKSLSSLMLTIELPDPESP